MRSCFGVRAAPRTGESVARSGARLATVGLTTAALVAGAGITAAVTASASSGVTTVRGTVERMTLDNFVDPLPEGRDVVTFVRSGDTTLQVPEDELADVQTGATVDLTLASTAGTRVTPLGSLVSDLGAAASQDPQAGVDVAAVQVVSNPTAGTSSTGAGVAVTSAAVAAGTAVHQVYVVVARPSGGIAPTTTPAEVAATINTGVDQYWSTVTGGRAHFVATAYPSVLPTANVPCSAGGVSTSGAFWNEIKAKVGWTEGSGKHLVVYFGAFAGCGGIAGLGTIGNGLGAGGVTWSNGYNNIGVLGHELGHNLGLGHSQELDCAVGGARVTDAAPSACSARSYWDTTDIMALSWNYQGYLNASHLRTLGLLDATSEAAPLDSGTVTLAPIENGTGLRVLTLSDGATRYVLEYRQPLGLDSWMSRITGWGSPGVLVRKEFDLSQAGTAPFDSIESYLLDGDPASNDASLGSVQTALPAGVWIDLADGRLGVRITSTSVDGAVIEYRSGPSAADPRYVAPPLPSLTVPVATVERGTVRPLSTGAVVGVRWTWRVSTPSVLDGGAASVATRRAVTPRRAGVSSWVPSSYRATAVGVGGTVVGSTATAYARYTTENSTSATRFSRRAWSVVKSSTAMGARLRVTAKRGAAVAAKVTGRSVGILLGRGARYGKVAVILDGHRVATLNLRAARSSVTVAWATTFPTSGRHTVLLVNLTGGASGNLGFDGVVTLR